MGSTLLVSTSPAKSRTGSELWLEVSREIFGGVTVVETGGGAVVVAAGAVAAVRAAGVESAAAGLALFGTSAGAGALASVVDIVGVCVVFPDHRGEEKCDLRMIYRESRYKLRNAPINKDPRLES